MEINLQMIFGTDKRNPYFSLYRNPDTNRLYVFYGAGIIQVVKDDKNNPEFKLLIARLYNARINIVVLIKTFGIARTTMKRWGDALKSGDLEILIRALSGQGPPKKLTKEIEAFSRVRFKNIYKEITHYNYSSIIRQEIEEVFGVKICGETLRPLFKKLKDEYNSNSSKSTGASTDIKEEGIENQVNNCDSSNKTEELKPEVFEENSQIECEKSANSQSIEQDDPTFKSNKSLDLANNRKNSLNLSFKNKNISGFSYHLGILIFSIFLNKINAYVTEGRTFILQWIVTILLGAKNIEQTKLLDFNSLRLILGEVTPSLYEQRNQLSQLNTENIIEELIRFNAEITSAKECTDFYYDPHTKHYTGIINILKGWCSSIHMADKILNMDFIHTKSGQPVFVEHNDNYDDLRVRFSKTVESFREHLDIDENMVLTHIVDRGIYSIEVFKDIIDDDKNHIITWEKNYKKDTWDEKKKTKKFYIFKSRNKKEDILKYEFEYIDQRWARSEKMRQLIVRATNPKGNSIVVSILTDDLNRNAEEIILLMFSRWIQENDFKYLEKHFGINQITSYKTIPYKKLEKTLEDKQVLRGEYKALQKQAGKIKSKLKTLLLKRYRAKKKDEKREEKLKNMTTDLDRIEHEISKTEKEESKIQLLIRKKYRRLNTNNKKIMDYIKIIARNIYYLALEPFKEKYNNYRDDHVLFRNLSRSHGYIKMEEEKVEAVLYPTVNYQEKLRDIINIILDDYNKQNAVFPDGSGRNLYLKLGEKTSKLFAI